MIKLRLVGTSTDLDHLVFTSRKTGKRGSHLVTIDDKLFRALEDVVRKRRAQKTPEPARKPPQDSKVSPSEVQRLLRAGRSVEQVAKMAGTDVAWVERFLGPVLDERAVAIQTFQRARLDKPRLGSSGLPVGESVERNLRTRRVKLSADELDSSWDASRLDTQPWVITLTFSFRGREQRATWRYDPRTREAVASNRLAGDLGWVPDGRRPAAPRPAAAPSAKPAKRRTPARKTTRKATAKRSGKKRTATKRRPAGKRPAARRPGTRRRTTARRTPARRPAARRPAARRPAPRRTSTRRTSRTSARRSARRRTAR